MAAPADSGTPTAQMEELLHVKAYVMVQDEQLHNMWNSRNELCDVIITRESSNNSYHITARRESDSKVEMHCIIQSDLVYQQASPVFHHWTVENKRHGLNFKTFTHAKTFELAVSGILNDIRHRLLRSK